MSKVYCCDKCRVPAVHKEWRGENYAFRLWWECPKCESSMHLCNMLVSELEETKEETKEETTVCKRCNCEGVTDPPYCYPCFLETTKYEEETEETEETCVIAIVMDKEFPKTLDYAVDEESFNQLTVEEIIELKGLIKSLHEKCNRRLFRIQQDLNAGMAE